MHFVIIGGMGFNYWGDIYPIPPPVLAPLVRPSLSYGAVIWINGLKTKQNITLLNSVQRLANILISGALPSSPGNALILTK